MQPRLEGRRGPGTGPVGRLCDLKKNIARIRIIPKARKHRRAALRLGRRKREHELALGDVLDGLVPQERILTQKLEEGFHARTVIQLINVVIHGKPL